MAARTSTPVNTRPYLALLVGMTVGFGAASVIRLAQMDGVPSLVIGAGRLLLATLILSPFVARRYGGWFARLTPRQIALSAFSGAMLGLHFATFIYALEYTSVLAALVLSNISPLFVALLSVPILGERVRRPVWIGIFAALLGMVLVAFGGAGDPPTRPAPVLGATLALASGLTMALYLMSGRMVRVVLPLVPYIWMVYGFAGLTMFLAVIVSGQSMLGHAPSGYFWILLLTLGPQLTTHGSLNYAVAHLSAAFVSLVTLLIPVGSSVVAFFLLGENPGLLSVVGSAFTLAAIGYVIWSGEA